MTRGGPTDPVAGVVGVDVKLAEVKRLVNQQSGCASSSVRCMLLSETGPSRSPRLVRRFPPNSLVLARGSGALAHSANARAKRTRCAFHKTRFLFQGT